MASNDNFLRSRLIRLWSDLTTAINEKNMEAATDAKAAVEDAQRDLRKKREESGEQYVPRFFENQNGRWMPKFRYVLKASFLFGSFSLTRCFTEYLKILKRLQRQYSDGFGRQHLENCCYRYLSPLLLAFSWGGVSVKERSNYTVSYE